MRPAALRTYRELLQAAWVREDPVGPVDTNLTAPLFAMAGAREEFLRHIPLGRVGRAEDIAHMILFLASEAAGWVTGQCFYVDGGQSLVALPPYIDLVERLLGATSPAP